MARQDDPLDLQPLYLPNVGGDSGFDIQPLQIPPPPTGPGSQHDESFWGNLTSPANLFAMGFSSLGDITGAAAATAFPPAAWLTYPALSGVGGFIGEAGRQYLAGEEWNPAMMTVEAGLNLMPGPNIPGKGAATREILKYGAKSGLYGAGQGALGAIPRHIASTGEWELPSAGEFAGQTLGGAAVGTVLGGTLAGAHAGYGRLRDIGQVGHSASAPPPIPDNPRPDSPYGAPRGYGYVEPPSTFPEISEGTSGKIADMSLEELQSLLNLAKQGPSEPPAGGSPFGAGIGQAGEGAGTGGFEWGKGEAPKSPYFGPNQTPLRPDGVIELDEKLSTPKTVAGLEADGYTNVGKNEKGQNVFKKLFSGDEGTFTPAEMWENLKRLLGRDPTPEEVDAGMRRQPGPDEPTGRIAQFPTPHDPTLPDYMQPLGAQSPRQSSAPVTPQGPVISTLDRLYDAVDNASDFKSLNNLRTEILSHYQQAPTGSDAKRVLADMLDDVSTKMRDIPGPRPVQEGIDQPRPMGEGGGPRDIDLGTQPDIPRGKGLFGGEEGAAPIGMFGPGWLKGIADATKPYREKFGIGMGTQPPPPKPTLGDKFPRGAPIGYGWKEGDPQPPKISLKPAKKESLAEKVIGASVASTTTGDLSAGFRQGLSQIFTKEWRTAAKKMFSALRSQENADAINAELLGRDIHKRGWDKKALKVIPSMADRMELPLIKGSDVSGSEMGFAESLIEKVPVLGKHYFKPTNRAYATFLNVLRTEMAEKLVKEAAAMSEEAATGRARMPGLMGGVKLPDFLGGGRTPGFSQDYTPKQAADLNPAMNDLLAKDIGKFIGNATGRGDLGRLEKHANWLRYLLFSPRLVASRINMLNPTTYMMATPFVRKQYLKSAIATGAAWYTFGKIAEMSPFGVTVSDDPDSADFGKVRMRNTRLDPGGGFQQFLVTGHRLWSGGATSSAGEPGTGVWHRFGSGYQATTAGDTTQRFFANKLNPAVKFVYDIAFQSTGYQKFQVGDRLIQSFVPLMLQDMWELAHTDPYLMPGVMPFVAGGMGTQTYEKGEVMGRFINAEDDWTLTGGGIRDLMPWNLGGDQTPSERQNMTIPGLVGSPPSSGRAAPNRARPQNRP